MWFITFSTYHRRPVFSNPDLLEACEVAIRETTERNGYRVKALVIMPDHVHAVVDPGDSGHERSKVLNNLKGVASRRVFQACPTLKLDLNSEHLWSDQYQAIPVKSPESLARIRRYIERNPMEIGLPIQRYSWIDEPRPAL